MWGRITINPEDSDAMNLYARVQRGDVDQCSFGFDILEEETEYRDNDTVHWTIKKVKLYEVSPCTFPAYEGTAISARKKEYENIKKRQLESWKERLKKMLKQLVLSKKLAEKRAAIAAIEEAARGYAEERTKLQTREAELAAALEEVTEETTEEDKKIVEDSISVYEADDNSLTEKEKKNAEEKRRS